MLRVTLLSTLVSLAACHDEQSSLLQTVSRDHALAKRAHNAVELEDEDVLDEAMEGKKCTNWLADEAVAKAHDELEHFRQEMKTLGLETNPNNHVKIGAYCPAVIADPALTFADTPCEDRSQALEECIKGLSETCKFEKKALKKMMETVKKTIQTEVEGAKKQLEKFPVTLQPDGWKDTLNIDYNELFKPINEKMDVVNCDSFKDLKVEGLSEDQFSDMKQHFDDALATLTSLQTQQIGVLIPDLVQAADDANTTLHARLAEEAAFRARCGCLRPPPPVTFQGHTMAPCEANKHIRSMNQGLTGCQRFCEQETDGPCPGEFQVDPETGLMRPR